MNKRPRSEERRRYEHEWYLRNKERTRTYRTEYMRKWRAANVDRYNAYQRERRAKRGKQARTPEIIAYQQKWYLKNRTRINEQRKAEYRALRALPATCHPDKPRFSKSGLCTTCERKQAIARKLMRPFEPSKCHPSRQRTALGLCAPCYNRRRKILGYGITPEILTDMLNAQHQRCAICQNLLDEHYHIDHSHKRKHVRGILCQRCNSHLLGVLESQTEYVVAALQYLARYNDLPNVLLPFFKEEQDLY